MKEKPDVTGVEDNTWPIHAPYLYFMKLAILVSCCELQCNNFLIKILLSRLHLL